MVRNWRVVGAPVFTTESGMSLWYANNEWTFRYFPRETIDLAGNRSLIALDAGRRAEVAAVASDPVAVDRLLGRFGREYIAAQWPMALAAPAKTPHSQG